MPLAYFCTPWKHQKTSGFMFSGGTEGDQWHETDSPQLTSTTQKTLNWLTTLTSTTQKMKNSIKDFFSKKTLMENFIFLCNVEFLSNAFS